MLTTAQKKGRRPSDYPQFAFRLSAEVKEKLSQMVKEVTDLYNENLPPGEYIFRKNDIIIDALERGLTDMKKDLPRKKKIKR